MPHKRIIAFSSSRTGNGAFFEMPLPLICQFLGPKPLNIAFIPFASVNKDYEVYFDLLRETFSSTPYKFQLVNHKNGGELIESTDVIMTGGGNTFKLLHDLYNDQLLGLIRDRINNGTVYIGWSAGSNILSPGIGTTNDMPVIQPESHAALGVFPFQINPHYFNKPIDGFNGETRDQRLLEFTKLNPGVAIVGLPEGTALLQEDERLHFIGLHPGVLFYFETPDIVVKKQIEPGQDISFFL